MEFLLPKPLSTIGFSRLSIDNKMKKWPDHYPERCPPSTAEEVSGKIYRFTNRTNPKHKDFLSYYELHPVKDCGKKVCNARGLSVFANEEDCRVAAATIPALRKKHLCVAELPKEAGVVADTPSNNIANHKTLWSLLGPQELADLFRTS